MRVYRAVVGYVALIVAALVVLALAASLGFETIAALSLFIAGWLAADLPRKWRAARFERDYMKLVPLLRPRGER